jgi:hypothetical protein
MVQSPSGRFGEEFSLFVLEKLGNLGRKHLAEARWLGLAKLRNIGGHSENEVAFADATKMLPFAQEYLGILVNKIEDVKAPKQSVPGRPF